VVTTPQVHTEGGPAARAPKNDGAREDELFGNRKLHKAEIKQEGGPLSGDGEVKSFQRGGMGNSSSKGNKSKRRNWGTGVNNEGKQKRLSIKKTESEFTERKQAEPG